MFKSYLFGVILHITILKVWINFAFFPAGSITDREEFSASRTDPKQKLLVPLGFSTDKKRVFYLMNMN